MELPQIPVASLFFGGAANEKDGDTWLLSEYKEGSEGGGITTLGLLWIQRILAVDWHQLGSQIKAWILIIFGPICH